MIIILHNLHNVRADYLYGGFLKAHIIIFK